MATLATRFVNKRQTDSSSPLTDDAIMRYAPSVFAADKHSSRSARYAMIPTADVLNGLRQHGFQPFMACQAVSRVEGKTEFTKHMLRLRHVDHIARHEANEIILINSHDGTSSYQMLAGCFRFVCSNGLISGKEVCDLRIKHSGNVVHEVIAGAHEALKSFEVIEEQKDGFKSCTLTPPEQRAFAAAAIAYRFDVADPSEAPVTIDQVLTPRRFEDQDRSLWATFNVLQENTVRGGVRTETRDANNRRRRGHTREITGIDGNVALNRALWVLADQLRQAVA